MQREYEICDLLLSTALDEHGQFNTDHTLNIWLAKNNVERYELSDVMAILHSEKLIVSNYSAGAYRLTTKGKDFIKNGMFKQLFEEQKTDAEIDRKSKLLAIDLAEDQIKTNRVTRKTAYWALGISISSLVLSIIALLRS